MKKLKDETSDWREEVGLTKAAPQGASGVGTPEFNYEGGKPLDRPGISGYLYHHVAQKLI